MCQALRDFTETRKQDAMDKKCKSERAATHLAVTLGVQFGLGLWPLHGKWRSQLSALDLYIIPLKNVTNPFQEEWHNSLKALGTFIFPAAVAATIQRRLGGKLRYVLKRLADSTKTIWLHTCHVPKTSPTQSNCNREM